MATDTAKYYVGYRTPNMSFKHISILLSTTLWASAAAWAQITPSLAVLGPSQQQQFLVQQSAPTASTSAPGQPSSSGFTNWTLVPSEAGTISSTGLYTAPASISAISYATVYAQFGSALYEARVQLNPTAAGSGSGSGTVPISVSVSPTFVYLYAGQTTHFAASVAGSSDQQVLWSITQGSGSIVNGAYTAPGSVSSDTLVTISAVSLADPAKNASATVLVGPSMSNPTPGVGIPSVTPASATLAPSGTQQFAVKNLPIGAAATWSISPSEGSITQDGFYTAPSEVPEKATIIVRATDSSTNTLLATASITLQPSATPKVSPAAATVAPSGTQQFSVLNLSSGESVTWSISPAEGSITASGGYTAPSDVASQTTVTITARNSSTSAVLGTASVTLQASPAASVNPATATVAPSGTKQFAVLNLPSGASVNWSVSPAEGSISAAGVYTAPSDVASQTTITVTAKNSSTLLGTASVTLQPSPTASVSPSTATLAPSGTKQFSVENLPSGDTVTWSISPAKGSISSSGLYTAPSSVASQTTVTVTAKSSSTVLGTASVTLQPSPTASVSPSTATLAPSGTKQFSVENLPSGDSVTWSISPTTGSISSSGLYTAPSSVASQTTVTVTAKSSSTVLGTASITLQASPTPSVSPSTATLAPSGTKQFSVENLPSGDSVTWSISPAKGSISSSGVYTAPSSVASQTTVTVTAKSSSTVLGTASITLQATAATANIMLPIEVFGTNATTGAPLSFSIPSGSAVSGQLRLWLQIHGLEYQAQASVQVNGGAWMPINDTTATYLGQANTFGGLGGGFSTLSLTMNLPSGSIQVGQNSITFRFNGTDGNSSGFRVLALNVWTSTGSPLIPSSTFTQDDPTSWTAPLTDAADIQAGQTLWQTANLTMPKTGAIQAKCGGCHAQDGRDLKYFNYSNASIEARSVFHGLTAQQGAQIASYIRTMNAPASVYATPWNPPYQPGAGMDSRAVTDWSAGAGLNAVVAQDSDMLTYLMPGGSTASWAASSYLNQREIPIQIQLPDWNHWLPRIHPLDAWGSSFTSSAWNQLYLSTRAQLVPNDVATDTRVLGPLGDFPFWLARQATFLGPLKAVAGAINETSFQTKYFSSNLWSDVKFWELNQEFGLEGMAQAFYGPKAPDRAWLLNLPFFTGPGISGFPIPAAAIGNGLPVTTEYTSFAWYQLQLLLNDGNGKNAIDWAYALGYPTNNFTWNAWANPPNGAPRVGAAGFLMEWLVKGLQADINDVAPNPSQFVTFPGEVSWPIDISQSQKVQLINSYLTVWIAKWSTSTRAELFALPGMLPTSSNPTDMKLGSNLIYALPQLSYLGADSSLLTQIASWAATIWPSYNWNADLNASCVTGNLGQVYCQ